MRKINKQEPIESFIKLSLDYRYSNWEDFVIKQHNVFEESRLTILIDEQCCLCGYTELQIDNERKNHIDHFRKKSLFPKLTFDWNNFIVAKTDDDFGAKYKDNKYKIKKEEYDRIFNPVVDNVQDYLEYNLWGEIKPKNGISENIKSKADKTIKAFNLNHNSLKHRRQNLIKQINACCEYSKEEMHSFFENCGFKSLLEQYC